MSRTVRLISAWTLPDDFLGSSGQAYFDEGKFEAFVDELAQVAGEVVVNGVGVRLRYTFDNPTADADPGVDTMRANNGAAASVTELYLSTTSAGADVTGSLAILGASNMPEKGQLMVGRFGDTPAWALYTVTGLTSATGYRKVAVTYVNGSVANPFDTDGTTLVLGFTRNGDKGEAGDVGNILAQPTTASAAMGDWIVLHSLAAGATRRITLDDLLGSTAITSMTVTTFTATTATVTDLTVSGSASLQGPAELTETETQWKVDTAATGTIQWRHDDPDVAYFKLTADTTIDFMGPWKPGNLRGGLTAMIVQGGAGGYDLTLQLGSRITNANDLGTDAIDTYHSRSAVTVAEDVVSPTIRGWTITASGAGSQQHGINARRGPVTASPWDYVYAALVKEGAVSSKARAVLQADSYGKGAYADFDLATGSKTGTGALSTGTHLASGIVPLTGDWAGWHVVWVAADVGSDGGVEITGRILMLDTGGNDTFTGAGETVLFGGDVMYAGATYMGFPIVTGASRLPTWIGPGEPPWTGQSAGAQTELQALLWPNGTFKASDITGT